MSQTMFNWLVRLWHKFEKRMHRRQIPPVQDTYHASNLHGRYR